MLICTHKVVCFPIFFRVKKKKKKHQTEGQDIDENAVAADDEEMWVKGNTIS